MHGLNSAYIEFAIACFLIVSPLLLTTDIASPFLCNCLFRPYFWRKWSRAIYSVFFVLTGHVPPVPILYELSMSLSAIRQPRTRRITLLLLRPENWRLYAPKTTLSGRCFSLFTHITPHLLLIAIYHYLYVAQRLNYRVGERLENTADFDS
jgi:hypothetical protein